MKSIKNMKIKTKLISGFIIVSLFITALGTIAAVNMNSINNRTGDMYSKNLIPSSDLAQVQKNLLLIRSDLLLMIYEKSTSKLEQRVSEISSLSDENTKLLNSYKTSTNNSEQQNIFNGLESTYIPKYAEGRSGIIKLVQEGKFDQASAMVPEVTASREKVEADISKLIQLNKAEAEKANNENNKTFNSQLILMAVIVGLGTILAIVIGLIISNFINKPLQQLLFAANNIAEGDLNVTLHEAGEDEIGQLTKAFRTMSENINDVMTNISIASIQVASGSKQVSDSSTNLSQASTEQASSVEELTSSLEEIAAQTRQNAENANKANDLSERVKNNALQGDTHMNGMLKAMEEINSDSSNIYKIIKVIDEIAFQTNILALNAAVEAARAGQHGKGFAVVAEEVRNLAARSANAAKETTVMIEGSIQKVQDGTKIANETANALNSIVEGISKVSNLVNEIAIASNEQASGIDQINQGILQVSTVVQNNSATSEESAAASEELSTQAELLRKQVEKFKLKKTQYSNTNLTELNSLNPEVIKMLEQMYNENQNVSKKTNTIKTNKINLSDTDFGKY
ncbi:MCP four helix bundle domain-containing protein [Clostridium sp. YIM B02505]|uniref:MCP four helix bundle domain-containing protein n=1 Tax=Clostridium yunnanense TaxID=2800325 RepID=A0ABS1EMA5_9CLOT|nr:methyl-accepting chemotaxis protein [Clostridium yunnanense]MBK1810477.1 MCP four helix bundle domain-containing protein [Clostridium yunnanense]